MANQYSIPDTVAAQIPRGRDDLFTRMTLVQASRFWLSVASCSHGEVCVTCCWPWIYRTSKQGYGMVFIGFEPGGKEVFAHRLAYLFTYGDIPSNLFVLHRCDSPPCCNPQHLWLGTHSDNMLDARRKGRIGKLTAEQVCEIRQLRGQLSAPALARRFDVSPHTIWKILTGRTWKHIS